MHGADRCNIHLQGGVRPGRSTLTDQVQDHLVSMLRAGNYIVVALRAVNVPQPTFTEWMQRGRRAEPRDARYVEFREAIEQARAMGEVRNVAVISAAAPENWQAAAWLLERSFPERWARISQREKLEPEDPEEKEPADPFSEADELAERRRQRS